jgi:cephalosporin-C deacetylase-like acetyl esterase
MKLALLFFSAAIVWSQDPQSELKAYLNNIGKKYLTARAEEIGRIKTRAEAEKRQQVVREKLLRLIGGLPSVHGPLNARSVGVIRHDDYRIEKIVYESLPGFYVTANVYVPAGSGPFPAVLIPMGHYATGKEGDRQIPVGLARKGFIAMPYDPIGQGERLQYYDADTGRSKVGGGTDEHSHANGQTLLIGDSVARYRIWDGIRGIDYLVSRKDVDAERIGCMGCSGGGTLTSYISALDSRVKVAVPACYITSWLALLEERGPQDGEQVFPGFLAEGLDFPDFIESFAPKPWLIESTKEDFFPLEGARQTYQEAKRFYALFGAEDNVQWFVGPGGHGVPPVSREALFAFFIKWLKNGQGDPKDQPVPLDPADDILVTETGQVADSLAGETVYTLNKKRAKEMIPPRQNESVSKLVADIRQLTAMTIQPGGTPPEVKVQSSTPHPGYKMDVVSYQSEPGITIRGVLLTPDGAGKKPAVLVVDSRRKERDSRLDNWATRGYVVLAISTRGVAESPPPPRRNEFLGDYSAAARAYVMGKTLVGMRADDIIRGIDYLASRADVDGTKIGGFGEGAQAVALVHAAVVDKRIARLILQNAMASYRAAVDHPVYRGLYDVMVPGVVRKYDMNDLLAALAPRTVTVISPADHLGRPLRGRHTWPENVKPAAPQPAARQ